MYYIEIYGSFKDLIYTVMIPNEEFGVEYGFFEYWDEETDGYDNYNDGELIFEDGELFDYNGVSSLPDFIIKEIAKYRKVNL